MEQGLWNLCCGPGLPRAYLGIRGREQEREQEREEAMTAFRRRREDARQI